MQKGIVAAGAVFVVLLAAFAVTGNGGLNAGASGQTPLPSGSSVAVGAKGDIDCSGDIGLNDVVVFLQALAGITIVDPDCSASPAGILPPRMDIDCDGTVDDIDALLLLLYLADVEQPLPTGCPAIGDPLETSTPIPTPTPVPTETPVATPTPTSTLPLSDSVVNTTSDHAPDGCHQLPGGDCTLREAILALTGGGIVTFDIPGAGCDGQPGNATWWRCPVSGEPPHHPLDDLQQHSWRRRRWCGGRRVHTGDHELHHQRQHCERGWGYRA